MKIAIAGLGYVGTSNAVLLAQSNHVIAFDILQGKIDKINKHISPIEDDMIDDFFESHKLNLEATADSRSAIRYSELLIIATPTNYDFSKKFFNTSSVESVIALAVNENPDITILIKSTIPVGFTEKMKKQYHHEKILFSPEFLREGQALYDNLYPSRIIVGGEHIIASKVAKLFMAAAKKKDVKVMVMSSDEAEAVKLFANTYLAMRVAYFNELDSYAELKGLSSRHIIDGVCADGRIGDVYNNPSFGYGGYSLPKDSKQLLANYSGVPQNIISAVVQSNLTRKRHIAHMIMKKKPDVVGIYRLTMKNGSDNYRESAVLDIMSILGKNNVEILIYEPTIMDDKYNGWIIENNLDIFAEKCDIILANRWNKELDNVVNKVYTRDIYIRD